MEKEENEFSSRMGGSRPYTFMGFPFPPRMNTDKFHVLDERISSAYFTLDMEYSVGKGENSRAKSWCVQTTV